MLESQEGLKLDAVMELLRTGAVERSRISRRVETEEVRRIHEALPPRRLESQEGLKRSELNGVSALQY